MEMAVTPEAATGSGTPVPAVDRIVGTESTRCYQSWARGGLRTNLDFEPDSLLASEHCDDRGRPAEKNTLQICQEAPSRTGSLGDFTGVGADDV